MQTEAADLDKIRTNIFPPAWEAITDPVRFPWHTDKSGRPQTWKSHSSQALAIDLFGTLKTSSQAVRDRFMNQLAAELGVRSGGPWKVDLEWLDPRNRLKEPRRTQIDAIAWGLNATVVFECKFTETGGPCSQPKRIAEGSNIGKRQCDGCYRTQVNPVNGITAKCALTGKGIRYWEIIPKVFELDAAATYRPCPFAGPWFQWMRNIALCYEIAREEARDAALAVVYPEGVTNTAGVVAHDFDGGPRLRKGVIPLRLMTYLQLVSVGKAAADQCNQDVSIWRDLRSWINKKTENVIASQDTAGKRRRVDGRPS